MLRVERNTWKCLSLLVGAFSALFTLFITTGVKAADVSTDVEVNYSLTVTIPSAPLNLNLDPGATNFGSKNLTVTVGTNNTTGYKTVMTSVSGGTDLVNTADSTKVIPTLDSGSYTQSTFQDNKWGYKQDSGNFQPFVPNTTIMESDTYANDDTTTLSFAAKVNYLQASGTYNTTLVFATTANPSLEYIQNLDPMLCTTEPMAVMDRRDGQIYVVQKLEDGNCWMMENLNLGATETLRVAQLDSSNTNFTGTNVSNTISATDFLGSGWKNNEIVSYVTPGYVPITTENSSDHLDTDPTSNTKYGTLYNYCAATAGTLCVNYNNGVDASSDLCPAGWRMPTGGTSGELRNLYSQSAYNTNAKLRAPYAATNGGAAFALAGYWNTAPKSQGGGGSYWTSTRYDNTTTVYYFNLNTTGVTPSSAANRNNGYTMRCILKTMQNFNSQDATAMATNESRVLTDVRDGQEYTVRKLGSGKVFMVDNLAIGCVGNYRRGGNLVLSSTNSNVQNNWTLSTTTTKSLSSADGECSSGASGTCTSFDNPRMKCDADNGSWYNYAAASAGTITGSSNSTNASYDICPKGWRLPTNTEFSGIISYASSFNLSQVGFYRYGSLNNISSDWWSSVAYSATSRYILLHNTSTTELRTDLSRTDGFFIRCVAK